MLATERAYVFSQGSSYVERSIMRDLLALAVDPQILSLAGGLPANEMLPVHALRGCMNAVLRRDGAQALQYGPPYPPLRAWIAEHMNARGVRCTPEQVFITNGNQQGLTILSRLFLDPGDAAVTEAAVFTGVQQVTAGRGARVRTVPTDLTDGIDVDALEAAFAAEAVRLAVVIPDFHNPLGVSMSAEKRRRVAELAAAYGVPVAEDDPYSMLRFAGEAAPPVKAYDEAGFVFYLGSFSKMLAPSLRLGWMIVPEELLPRITVLRESLDLESSGLTQRTVAEFLARGLLAPHLRRLNASNRQRRDTLLAALDAHLGDIATWTEPEGGLFVWLTLPEHIDTYALLPRAIEEQVLYIPGAAFMLAEGPASTMRLNFSSVALDDFDEAVARLARVVRRAL